MASANVQFSLRQTDTIQFKMVLLNFSENVTMLDASFSHFFSIVICKKQFENCPLCLGLTSGTLKELKFT